MATLGEVKELEKKVDKLDGKLDDVAIDVAVLKETVVNAKWLFGLVLAAFVSWASWVTHAIADLPSKTDAVARAAVPTMPSLMATCAVDFTGPCNGDK